MNDEKNEYSFLWFIKNYSYFWTTTDKELVSTETTFQELEDTSWSICLYPGYIKYKRRDLNSIYLKRNDHDAGPENFSVKLEISFITVDGSILYSEECECTFKKGDECGFKPLLDMDDLYVRRNTEYLPRDTLVVCCRMWHERGSVPKIGRCSARTRIGIEKISFLHSVENFSALKLGEWKTIQIPSHSKNGRVISSSVYVCNTLAGDEPIIVGIVPSDSNYILCTKKLSLLDKSGSIIECGEVDYRFLDVGTDIQRLERQLTRQFLLKNGWTYLPNNELTLFCECTFSIGPEHAKIEETVHGIPFAAYKPRFHNVIGKNINKTADMFSTRPSTSRNMKVSDTDKSLTQVHLQSNAIWLNTSTFTTGDFKTFCNIAKNNPHKYNATEKLSTCPSVQDDFKAIYNEKLFTDVVLKTATIAFPAHKIVLCARSSVFRAMLTNDMKEKNTDCIKVEDLEDETVQRLLLFLYSDNLEHLQWESAVQLYYAADKYAVEKLKVLCSSFLAENLSTSTASELLLLADTHSDPQLKQIVVDFILKHEKEIFRSKEWDKLSETNPQLVIQTMKLKFNRE
ncbi:unnamed protein product [Larinioides sclopetarius]|uniref:Speckle-type POZ protein n=1 Tax=Larinioides sclopetarius TaxID=280406 RepID=A0AAV2ACU1_9ARAC